MRRERTRLVAEAASAAAREGEESESCGSAAAGEREDALSEFSIDGVASSEKGVFAGEGFPLGEWGELSLRLGNLGSEFSRWLLQLLQFSLHFPVHWWAVVAMGLQRGCLAVALLVVSFLGLLGPGGLRLWMLSLLLACCTRPFFFSFF